MIEPARPVFIRVKGSVRPAVQLESDDYPLFHEVFPMRRERSKPHLRGPSATNYKAYAMRYRPTPSLCLIEDRSESAIERPDLPKPPISKHTGSNPVSTGTSKNRNIPSEISTDQHESGAAGSSHATIPRHSSPLKFSTSHSSRAPAPLGSDNFEKHHDRSPSHASKISGTTPQPSPETLTPDPPTESNIAARVCPTPSSINTSPSPVGLDIPMLETPQIRPAPLNTTLGSPETALASHDVPMSDPPQVNPAIPNSAPGSTEPVVVSESPRRVNAPVSTSPQIRPSALNPASSPAAAPNRIESDILMAENSRIENRPIHSATLGTTPTVTNPLPARSDVHMHNNKETDARAPPATTVSVVPAPSDNPQGLHSPRSSPLHFPQTPLLRQRKAIRNQTEHLGWFKSTRNGPLLAPPLAIPVHYQVLPKVGDVYVHHDKTTASFKTWVWCENQWTAATGELPHPILTDYRLKVSSTGEPSWVTKKSLVSEKGRDKRKLWE